jgi:hypothetical protein
MLALSMHINVYEPIPFRVYPIKLLGVDLVTLFVVLHIHRENIYT